MNRRFIALLVMFALGLQGSWAAFAEVSPPMQHDCGASSEPPADTAHRACCPGGAQKTGCCLGVGVAAAALPMTPQGAAWHGGAAPAPQLVIMIFSSRGNSPLIRPPIL